MSAQVSMEAVNNVELVGRVSGEPAERMMPSGSVLVFFRVVVDRPADHESGQRVDTIDCAAWGGRVQRSVRGWRHGDVVSVQGALRRSFFSTATGKASRVELEVTAARVLRRAANA